jgi:site-specific DNA-methyltransferase (adenine-specific)
MGLFDYIFGRALSLDGKLEINKIYNENCLDTMAKMPDNFVDLIVTSPPYNCGIKYDVYNDYRPKQEYYEWCRQWIKECYRVLKPNRRIALNALLNKGNNRKGQGREQPVVYFSNFLVEVGFTLNNITLWMDDHRVKYTAWGSWKSASSPYIFCPYEVIIMANKGDWKRDDKGISDITGEEFKTWTAGQWIFHPARVKGVQAPFPRELPYRCIKLLSYVGDLIYDPFMGSGTTCNVARELNRNYIGSEISAKYCRVAEKQIIEMGC